MSSIKIQEIVRYLFLVSVRCLNVQLFFITERCVWYELKNLRFFSFVSGTLPPSLLLQSTDISVYKDTSSIIFLSNNDIVTPDILSMVPSLFDRKMIDNVIHCITSWFWIQGLIFCVLFFEVLSPFHCCPVGWI